MVFLCREPINRYGSGRAASSRLGIRGTLSTQVSPPWTEKVFYGSETRNSTFSANGLHLEVVVKQQSLDYFNDDGIKAFTISVSRSFRRLQAIKIRTNSAFVCVSLCVNRVTIRNRIVTSPPGIPLRGIPPACGGLLRWGRDSNPRYAHTYTCFRGRLLQPLGHPTGRTAKSQIIFYSATLLFHYLNHSVRWSLA